MNSNLLFGGAAVVVTLIAVLVWRAMRDRWTGPYRVEVWESNGSTSEKMFESLRDARSYADDAASDEPLGEEPMARVFDAAGKEIYEGRHWVLRAWSRKH